MMPRVDESPSGEGENRDDKKEAEDLLAKKKLDKKKDKRPEKHQTPTQAMRRAPGLGIFESPGRAGADKIIRPSVAEIISQDDEENEHADHDDSAAGEVLA